MRKLVSCMHISLDGFVGEPGHAGDWIKMDEEMFDLTNALTEQADTALYGRGTYEIMESYWPGAGDKPGASKHDKEHSSWYNRVEKIVFSKTLKAGSLKNARIIGEDAYTEIKKLKQVSGNNILLFGSPGFVRNLIQENLIDEYLFFVNPVLAGRGRNLFDSMRSRVNLKLVSERAFPCGVVALHYDVIR